MKKNILYTVVITLFIFTLSIFVACKKNLTMTDTVYGVDVKSNPSMVNKAMRLYGKLTNGNMPFSTGTLSGGLLIVQNPKAIEVAAGVDVYIPFKTSNDSNIAKMYVQVEGADSYWELPPRPAGITSGSLHMKIFIPNFVHKGDFNLIFSVQDNQGKISSTATTNTIITGTLPCNASATGSIGVTVKAIDLGDRYGLIRLRYDTYSIPDRIDIKHNNIWKASTGFTTLMGSGYFPTCDNYSFGSMAGFVGEEGVLLVERNPGEDKNLYIYVTGCESSTRWDISLECPEENWHTNLPPCPCTYSEAQSLPNSGTTTNPNGAWSVCGTANSDYHYGATYEIRWLPSLSIGAGQQCTYDAHGDLITEGIAAGSPDKVSPMSCGFWTWLINGGATIESFKHHKLNDMIPWETISCEDYLKSWPSNNSKQCKKNPVSSINHMLQMVKGLTCEEVTFLLKKANTTLINPALKDFILGINPNMTNSDLKTKLQNWKDLNSCMIFPTDELCTIIDKAINNL